MRLASLQHRSAGTSSSQSITQLQARSTKLATRMERAQARALPFSAFSSLIGRELQEPLLDMATLLEQGSRPLMMAGGKVVHTSEVFPGQAIKLSDSIIRTAKIVKEDNAAYFRHSKSKAWPMAVSALLITVPLCVSRLADMAGGFDAANKLQIIAASIVLPIAALAALERFVFLLNRSGDRLCNSAIRLATDVKNYAREICQDAP